MRRVFHRATIVAAIAAASLTAASAPAFAQTSPVYRTVLGAGSDESSQNISWRSKNRGTEAVKIYETANPEAVRFFKGTEQNNGALLYLSKEATVTGLKPSTSYTYSIGSTDSGWSEEYTFTTGDGDGNWNFLALADAQIGVNLRNRTQGENWRKALATATEDFPETEMIMSLGDQVDGWGAIEPQYNEYFSAPQLRSIPTAAIPGNHETYVAGMKHFQEHFSLPNEVGTTSNHYFERNNVLFISLNSNLNKPGDIAAHKEFLRTTVEKHGASNDWIIVSYHHGPFAQGSHTSDSDVTTLRTELTPTLSELGVDAVLSGHDHIYTRSHLMEGTEPVVPETRARRGDKLTPEEGQVLYLTTTTAGGGKYYDFHDRNGTAHPEARRELMDTELEQPWTAYWNQDYTPDYTNVEVTPTSLTFTTYDVNTHNVVDKVSLNK